VLPIRERAHGEVFARAELRDGEPALGLALDVLTPERMELEVGRSGHGAGSCEATVWTASQVTRPGKAGTFERLQSTSHAQR
jgi:hypothetical protein